MDIIIVSYYDHRDKNLKSVQVEAHGLASAIEEVRWENDYKVLVLSAEYQDITTLINSL